MTDKESPYRVRDSLNRLQAYEPGKPMEEIQAKYNLDELPVKLASNENPYSPPAQLKNIYEQEFSKLNRYPDGGCFYLREALADKYDWPAEGIVVGAGSDEILDCLAKATLEPGLEIVCGDPSFVIYQMDALMMGAEPKPVPVDDNFDLNLEAMLKQIGPQTRWVCIPNPNNPTSRYLSKQEFKEFYERLPGHCLLLIDEAYFELMTQPDYPNGIDFLKTRNAGQAGVVVLRTFSKAYALPGLRVGYGLMEPELASELHKVRPPFNVNRPAQALAKAALNEAEFLETSRKKIISERERLLKEFDRRQINYVPPSANFILVEAPGDFTGEQLFEDLLPEGVIVRSMAPYGLKNHFRLTVGRREENDQFLAALDQVCGF